METAAERTSTGKPLCNVGIVDKVIRINISRSATEEEVENIIDVNAERYGVPESAPIIVRDDHIMFCMRPICPYCDMDFRYYAFLKQHLDSSAKRDSCLSS